jgi:hypothetical protein
MAGGPFGIGDQILRGFIGNNTLRDYTHASRVFTTNSYELKPRFKFLFHVTFTINVQEIPFLKSVFDNDTIKELSYVVKTVDLPKFQVETEILNQYNRKRVIQKRINYQPVSVVFHDDGGDNVRKLWYYYYSYYYKDAAQKYLSDTSTTNGSPGNSANRQSGFGYNARDIYDNVQQIKDWGFAGESWTDGTSSSSGKPPFFRDIQIYGMDQRKFAQWVLINPVIKSWDHDRYDYSQGNGIMANTMTIDYETVKYYSGAIGRNAQGGTNIPGFGDSSHYDTTLSPIARPGANSTIFGQGGLLEAGFGIVNDLQSGTVGGLIGAAQTAMRVNQTVKGKNLQSILVNESKTVAQQEIIQALPGATRSVLNKPVGIFVPTPRNSQG